MLITAAFRIDVIRIKTQQIMPVIHRPEIRPSIKRHQLSINQSIYLLTKSKQHIFQHSVLETGHSCTFALTDVAEIGPHFVSPTFDDKSSCTVCHLHYILATGYNNCQVIYSVGQKSKPVLIYQQIASDVRKALLFCICTNSGTTASYSKLFALLLVLNILWFSVADTWMRRSSTHIAKYTHSNWHHTLHHTYNI